MSRGLPRVDNGISIAARNDRIRALAARDPTMTKRALAERFGLSETVICNILHEEGPYDVVSGELIIAENLPTRTKAARVARVARESGKQNVRMVRRG